RCGKTSRVTPEGDPLASLKGIDDARFPLSERPHDLPRVVGRIIVYDDHLVPGGIEILTDQALEGTRQDLSTIIRADDDREVSPIELSLHDVLARIIYCSRGVTNVHRRCRLVLAAGDKTDIEVSVVMPCLNEADTLE